MRVRVAVRRARKLCARGVLRIVALLTPGQAVPVDLIRAIRLIGSGPDPLMPRAHLVDGERLDDPVLAAYLKGVALGEWALGPCALEVVAAMVAQHQPDLIIEFGSGASTVALAHAMRRVSGMRPSVISLEQDSSYADRTRELLARSGLLTDVVIVAAPLERQWIEGALTTCYRIPEDFPAAFAGRRAGLVVIDGPFARPGARFGTLPLIREFVAKDTPFLLDDAVRDGELNIARRWGHLPYVRIHGIRLVEKGILIGTISGPA